MVLDLIEIYLHELTILNSISSVVTYAIVKKKTYALVKSHTKKSRVYCKTKLEHRTQIFHQGYTHTHTLSSISKTET